MSHNRSDLDLSRDHNASAAAADADAAPSSRAHLRALVRQQLAQAGVLAAVQAQLRAGVFHALSETGSVPRADSQALAAQLASSNGRTALALVTDFLRSCNLPYTLETLTAEIGSSTPTLPTSSQLAQSLSITAKPAEPLLTAVVQRAHARPQQTEATPHMLRTARKTFQDYDQAAAGVIEGSKLTEVLQAQFPHLSSVTLQRYISSSVTTHLVDFDEYMALYIRLLGDWPPQTRAPTSATAAALRTNGTKAATDAYSTRTRDSELRADDLISHPPPTATATSASLLSNAGAFSPTDEARLMDVDRRLAEIRAQRSHLANGDVSAVSTAAPTGRRLPQIAADGKPASNSSSRGVAPLEDDLGLAESLRRMGSGGDVEDI